MVERRAHPRIRLRRKVSVHLSSGDIVYAWTYDLSLGGLQILTEYSADPGDEFEVSLGVVDPGTDRYVHVQMRNRIVHLLYDGSAACFRIGMKILAFREEAAADAYARFLETKLDTPLARVGM